MPVAFPFTWGLLMPTNHFPVEYQVRSDYPPCEKKQFRFIFLAGLLMNIRLLEVKVIAPLYVPVILEMRTQEIKSTGSVLSFFILLQKQFYLIK